MDPKSHLTHLAGSVTLILVGGSQSPVTVTPWAIILIQIELSVLPRLRNAMMAQINLLSGLGRCREWVAACRAVLQNDRPRTKSPAQRAGIDHAGRSRSCRLSAHATDVARVVAVSH